MANVFMIPAQLHEEGTGVIPGYVLDTVKQCQVLFVENERTTRRYFKSLSKEIVIDDFEWFNMTEKTGVTESFRKKLNEGKNIGIISEAGCPGIADPGQALAAIAQEMNIAVRPLVGPNSILLALMGSGMNGQQFEFLGYLPIDNNDRVKALREIEATSQKKNSTQIFIETPYRNNQLIEAILKTCKPSTRLCIAVDITAKDESIRTKKIADWQKSKVDIHKKPAIFLLHAGE